jgi:hypothetical protein
MTKQGARPGRLSGIRSPLRERWNLTLHFKRPLANTGGGDLLFAGFQFVQGGTNLGQLEAKLAAFHPRLGRQLMVGHLPTVSQIIKRGHGYSEVATDHAGGY